MTNEAGREEAGSPAIPSDGTVHVGVPNTAPQAGQINRTASSQEDHAAGLAVAVPDELARHLESEHHAIRAQEIDSPLNACSLKETCQWVKRIALATPMSESRARELLGAAVREDGSLNDDVHNYLWWKGGKTACLDGNFTPDELKAIAWWMELKQSAKP